MPKPKLPPLQSILPVAEREANLAKYMEGAAIPDRLYHATTATEGNKGVEALRNLKLSKEGSLGSGIYMHPNPEFVNEYAQGVGGNILPLHTNMKNPLYITHSDSPDPMKDALIKLGVHPDKADAMVERAYEQKGYIGKEVQSRAQAAGYDGLVQMRDGQMGEVVSYNPNAVKSAIGNTGEYDPYSNLLGKADGGMITDTQTPTVEAMKDKVQDPQAVEMLNLDLAKLAVMNQPQRMASGGQAIKLLASNLLSHFDPSVIKRAKMEFGDTSKLTDAEYQKALAERANQYRIENLLEKQGFDKSGYSNVSGSSYHNKLIGTEYDPKYGWVEHETHQVRLANHPDYHPPLVDDIKQRFNINHAVEPSTWEDYHIPPHMTDEQVHKVLSGLNIPDEPKVAKASGGAVNMADGGWMQDAYRAVVPAQVRTFAETLMGDRSPITEQNFTESELNQMRQAIANSRIAREKENIDAYNKAKEQAFISSKKSDLKAPSTQLDQTVGYQHYGTDGKAVRSDLDITPSAAVRNTLGKFAYHKDPQGNLVATDYYKFKDDLPRETRPTAEYEGMSTPEKLWTLAKDSAVIGGLESLPSRIGSAFIGGDGRPVEVNLGKANFAHGGAVHKADGGQAEMPYGGVSLDNLPDRNAFSLNSKPSSQAYTGYDVPQIDASGKPRELPKTSYDMKLEMLNNDLEKGIKPDWMSDVDFAQDQVSRGRGQGHILPAALKAMSFPYEMAEKAIGSSMGIDPTTGIIGKTGELHSVPNAGRYIASRVAPELKDTASMAADLYMQGRMPGMVSPASYAVPPSTGGKILAPADIAENAKSKLTLEQANQSALRHGLSADPYTRSLQQGYEHGWYHGGTGDITSFDPRLLGETTGAASAKKGFFFARDPQNPPEHMMQKSNDPTTIEMLRKAGVDVDALNKVSFEGHGAETASGYAKIGGDREYKEAMRNAKSAEARGDWDEHDKWMQIAEDHEISRMNLGQGLVAKYGDARDVMLDKLEKAFYGQHVGKSQPELEAVDKQYKQLFPYGWYASSTPEQFNAIKSNLVKHLGESNAAPVLDAMKQFESIRNERNIIENTQSGSNVIPAALRYKNPLVHDFQGNSYRDQTYSDLVDQALRNNHDALLLKNTYDPGGGSAKLVDVGVVFDPAQIRSRFAKFDPEHIESTDITKADGGSVHFADSLDAMRHELTKAK